MKTPLTLLLCFISSFLLGQNIKTVNKNLKDQLSDFNFEINYIQVDTNLNMAYVDEGKKGAPIVLLLHGEPSWSYTFRNIIPALVKSGFRVIAPDMIGFGFSDKFSTPENYTYTNQTKWVTAFIQKLQLQNINVFAHDWGGMIALRIIAEKPALFSKVSISYAYLFTGEEKVPESFYGWVDFAQNNKDFSPGLVINWGSNTKVSENTIKDYNIPYQNEMDKVAVREFPGLIPTDKLDKEAITNKRFMEKLKLFDKPFLTIWGNHNDEMWVGKDTILQQSILGAQHLDHKTLESNHFITEDQPEELVKILVSFFN